MGELVLVAVAGFCASLVDGALGMGFGPTSSSILLGTGLSPASVSTTVNIAKVATGAAAAVSHWRFRNIDPRIALRLAGWGCLGAVLGVTVLSNVDGDNLKPVLAALLTVIGLRILVRFRRYGMDGSAGAPDGGDPDGRPSSVPRGLGAVAVTGGVTNGLIGAWGPVATPFLMHHQVPPRFAVGSVNTAETAVALVSAGSLLGALGGGGLDVPVVVAMLAGGVLAAPVAAWVVRHVAPRPMGIAVAALLLLTNSRELASWAGLGASRWFVYAAAAALVVLAARPPRSPAPTVPRPNPGPAVRQP